MKRFSFCLIMNLLASCLAFAQQGVQIFHARAYTTIVRPVGTDSVLMIPVQESAGEATVRIIAANQELERLHIRIAQTHTDYFVPLYLQRFPAGASLEIRSFPEERHRVSDFICWRDMHTVANYDPTNTEPYRSLVHYTPLYGWMNDPNGMFYDDQHNTWHLYYQYNPYGSMWGNMHWGHATSTDLVHWQYQPIALRPTAWGTVFSGSAVIDKQNVAGFGQNAIVAFYTADGEAQTQNIAYSTDGGYTFTHYPLNPVLTADIHDFRDPKVFFHAETQRWIMIVSAGQEMRIFSSANLKDWQFESSFGDGYGNHGGVWECPDLFRLPVAGTDETRWVLVCNINPGGPAGGSATQYFVGDFDGHVFTCEDAPETEKWMDYGKDHYAAVSFSNAPDGRCVVLAWMSNWQYANELPMQQFRSQNSLPCDLKLYRTEAGDCRLQVLPSAETQVLRGQSVQKTAFAVPAHKPVTKALRLTGNAGVIDLEATLQSADKLYVALQNANGDNVTLCYDRVAQTLSVNRENSGKTDFSAAFPVTTVAPLCPGADTDLDHVQLTLFLDRCSMEVFTADGHAALTNLIFPTDVFQNIIFSTDNGKCKINNLQIFTYHDKP